MGIYKYIQKNWHKPRESMPELMKQRLIDWRQEEVTVRIAHPTRLDRARSLGYKPKQGVIIVRQRVNRGGHTKPMPKQGRRSRKYTSIKLLTTNYQTIAEQRVAKAYPNCEVLNSYEVGKDGKHYWYEVILLDRAHPAIKADPMFSGVAAMRGRPFRGLTSSARKSRGLRRKGKGAEKLRPSKEADREVRKY